MKMNLKLLYNISDNFLKVLRKYSPNTADEGIPYLLKQAFKVIIVLTENFVTQLFFVVLSSGLVKSCEENVKSAKV